MADDLHSVETFQFRPNATTTQGVIPVGFQGVVDTSGVYNILYRLSSSSMDAPNEYMLETMIFRARDFAGGMIPPLQQRIPTESLEVIIRYTRPLSSATARAVLPHIERMSTLTRTNATHTDIPEREAAQNDDKNGTDDDQNQREDPVDIQTDLIPISLIPHVQQTYTLKPITDVLFVAPNVFIPSQVEALFLLFTARVLPTNRDLADYRKAIDDGAIPASEYQYGTAMISLPRTTTGLLPSGPSRQSIVTVLIRSKEWKAQVLTQASTTPAFEYVIHPSDLTDETSPSPPTGTTGAGSQLIERIQRDRQHIWSRVQTLPDLYFDNVNNKPVGAPFPNFNSPVGLSSPQVKTLNDFYSVIHQHQNVSRTISYYAPLQLLPLSLDVSAAASSVSSRTLLSSGGRSSLRVVPTTATMVVAIVRIPPPDNADSGANDGDDDDHPEENQDRNEPEIENQEDTDIIVHDGDIDDAIDNDVDGNNNEDDNNQTEDGGNNDGSNGGNSGGTPPLPPGPNLPSTGERSQLFGNDPQLSSSPVQVRLIPFSTASSQFIAPQLTIGVWSRPGVLIDWVDIQIQLQLVELTPLLKAVAPEHNADDEDDIENDKQQDGEDPESMIFRGHPSINVLEHFADGGTHHSNLANLKGQGADTIKTMRIPKRRETQQMTTFQQNGSNGGGHVVRFDDETSDDDDTYVTSPIIDSTTHPSTITYDINLLHQHRDNETSAGDAETTFAPFSTPVHHFISRLSEPTVLDLDLPIVRYTMNRLKNGPNSITNVDKGRWQNAQSDTLFHFHANVYSLRSNYSTVVSTREINGKLYEREYGVVMFYQFVYHARPTPVGPPSDNDDENQPDNGNNNRDDENDDDDTFPVENDTTNPADNNGKTIFSPWQAYLSRVPLVRETFPANQFPVDAVLPNLHTVSFASLDPIGNQTDSTAGSGTASTNTSLLIPIVNKNGDVVVRTTQPTILDDEQQRALDEATRLKGTPSNTPTSTETPSGTVRDPRPGGKEPDDDDDDGGTAPPKDDKPSGPSSSVRPNDPLAARGSFPVSPLYPSIGWNVTWFLINHNPSSPYLFRHDVTPAALRANDLADSLLYHEIQNPEEFRSARTNFLYVVDIIPSIAIRFIAEVLDVKINIYINDKYQGTYNTKFIAADEVEFSSVYNDIDHDGIPDSPAIHNTDPQAYIRPFQGDRWISPILQLHPDDLFGFSVTYQVRPFGRYIPDWADPKAAGYQTQTATTTIFPFSGMFSYTHAVLPIESAAPDPADLVSSPIFKYSVKLRPACPTTKISMHFVIGRISSQDGGLLGLPPIDSGVCYSTSGQNLPLRSRHNVWMRLEFMPVSVTPLSATATRDSPSTLMKAFRYLLPKELRGTMPGDDDPESFRQTLDRISLHSIIHHVLSTLPPLLEDWWYFDGLLESTSSLHVEDFHATFAADIDLIAPFPDMDPGLRLKATPREDLMVYAFTLWYGHHQETEAYTSSSIIYSPDTFTSSGRAMGFSQCFPLHAVCF